MNYETIDRVNSQKAKHLLVKCTEANEQKNYYGLKSYLRDLKTLFSHLNTKLNAMESESSNNKLDNNTNTKNLEEDLLIMDNFTSHFEHSLHELLKSSQYNSGGETQYRIEEQDKQLELLEHSIKRQREMGLLINDQLNEHIQILDETTNNINTTQDNMHIVNTKAKAIVQKIKENRSTIYSIALIVTVVLLGYVLLRMAIGII